MFHTVAVWVKVIIVVMLFGMFVYSLVWGTTCADPLGIMDGFTGCDE